MDINRLLLRTHVLFLLAAAAMSAGAQPLTVATYECPPFVIRGNDATFDGLSIRLWDEIARNLGVEYTLRELPLAELLKATAAGEVDAGISCISITPEREQTLDFSHSFYETHLAIAVRDEGFLTMLRNIITDRETLYWVGLVIALAALVGGIFYLLEHKRNTKLYSRKSSAGRAVEGFILGLLFITRGPVNYYEFQTLTGRILTVLLAVFTTLFVASFTAILASSFTLERLRSDITGPADLAQVRVGIKEASTAGDYLDSIGVAYRSFPAIPDLLEGLAAGALDAVVADDPVLRYQAKVRRESGAAGSLTVLPYQFERQNYGIALPDDSALAENVDQGLLWVRETSRWQAELSRYLGTGQ